MLCFPFDVFFSSDTILSYVGFPTESFVNAFQLIYAIPFCASNVFASFFTFLYLPPSLPPGNLNR